MWGKSKEWLADVGGVSIPDDDSIHADAVAPGYKYDSMTRVVLESKEDIRKRGLPSPDQWDAIALTFAEPVIEYDDEDEFTFEHETRNSATGY